MSPVVANPPSGSFQLDSESVSAKALHKDLSLPNLDSLGKELFKKSKLRDEEELQEVSEHPWVHKVPGAAPGMISSIELQKVVEYEAGSDEETPKIRKTIRIAVNWNVENGGPKKVVLSLNDDMQHKTPNPLNVNLTQKSWSCLRAIAEADYSVEQRQTVDFLKELAGINGNSLAGIQMEGLTIKDLELPGINLSNAKLKRVEISGGSLYGDWRGASIVDCNFSHVSFTASNFNGAKILGKSSIQGCSFYKSSLRNVAVELGKDKSSFVGNNITYADLVDDIGTDSSFLGNAFTLKHPDVVRQFLGGNVFSATTRFDQKNNLFAVSRLRKISTRLQMPDNMHDLLDESESKRPFYEAGFKSAVLPTWHGKLEENGAIQDLFIISAGEDKDIAINLSVGPEDMGRIEHIGDKLNFLGLKSGEFYLLRKIYRDIACINQEADYSKGKPAKWVSYAGLEDYDKKLKRAKRELGRIQSDLVKEKNSPYDSLNSLWDQLAGYEEEFGGLAREIAEQKYEGKRGIELKEKCDELGELFYTVKNQLQEMFWDQFGTGQLAVERANENSINSLAEQVLRFSDRIDKDELKRVSEVIDDSSKTLEGLEKILEQSSAPESLKDEANDILHKLTKEVGEITASRNGLHAFNRFRDVYDKSKSDVEGAAIKLEPQVVSASGVNESYLVWKGSEAKSHDLYKDLEKIENMRYGIVADVERVAERLGDICAEFSSLLAQHSQLREYLREKIGKGCAAVFENNRQPLLAAVCKFKDTELGWDIEQGFARCEQFGADFENGQAGALEFVNMVKGFEDPKEDAMLEAELLEQLNGEAIESIATARRKLLCLDMFLMPITEEVVNDIEVTKEFLETDPLADQFSTEFWLSAAKDKLEDLKSKNSRINEIVAKLNDDEKPSWEHSVATTDISDIIDNFTEILEAKESELKTRLQSDGDNS
jgi:uncharacterized protein YjbI with pentapeptide repeats